MQSLLTYWRICNESSIGFGVQTGGYARRRDAHHEAAAKGVSVAAPRTRLSRMRLAALPEARAERRAGGAVENSLFVFGLRPDARLEAEEKKTRKPGDGLPSRQRFEAIPPRGPPVQGVVSRVGHRERPGYREPA